MRISDWSSDVCSSDLAAASAAAARLGVGEMAFLTDDEKRRLRQRIEAAERQTRGELVTVIARQSDAYLFIPLLWASLVALSIPPVVVLADLWIDLATVSTIQLATLDRKSTRLNSSH